MTFDAYINPDFTIREKLIFFLFTLLGVILIDLLIIGVIKLYTLSLKRRDRAEAAYELVHNRVQRFYEMMIAGT